VELKPPKELFVSGESEQNGQTEECAKSGGRMGIEKSIAEQEE